MTDSAACVWTIPAGSPFARTLVEGVLARFSTDPLTLADATLLLPNRRAARTVQSEFLRAVDARATLLPKLQVLGEDEDDALDTSTGIADAAVPELERLALLTGLIERWQASTGITLCATPAYSLRLAKSLARLLDQSITEGLDFAALQTLVPDEYAHHWQQVLTFLEIVTQSWPLILAERGQSDAAALRRKALEQQAARWTETPPSAPIIAAGSTGSIPATAQLLAVIARLPQGHVVLPGLNADMPAAQWEDVEEAHPQGALKRLLSTLNVDRANIRPWRETPLAVPVTRRLAMINSALAPAAHFNKSIAAHTQDGLIPGLHLAQVDGERVEASLIALVLRETLETPEKTAALITPDRTLARQVRAHLTRWGVDIDDSAGIALLETPPAQFMRLLANAAASDWAPAPLLALLKHPLFHAGFDRAEALAAARMLDISLRGPRRSGGLKALLASSQDEGLTVLLERLIDAAALWPQDNAPLAGHLAQHMAAAERLSASPEGSALFDGVDGNALALFCDEIQTLESGFSAVQPEHYAALFETLMEGRAVRSGIARHPRLAILGTIEARMTHADVMVLGGLNDGIWPPAPNPDPWMNEPMRVGFGLPPAGRRIGLSAHDFVQACGAPEVWLTRTTKSDGAPTLASRWVSRLTAAYGDKITRPEAYIQWAETIDHPAAYKPHAQPAPRPPLAQRPRNLSVSDIERWMRDPYALYARKVLRVEPLKQLDEAPGAADRGSAIHDALEVYFNEAGSSMPSHSGLMKAGETAFAAWKDRPSVWALWWPRFEDLAAWVIKEQTMLTLQGRSIAAIESSGQRVFNVAGAQWTIRAKADRIDLGPDGLVILDYKTGSVPSKTAMRQGYAPQLPLEGLIAEASGFQLPKCTVAGFEYWSLGTTSSKGPQRDAKFDADALMAMAHEGLTMLFAAFGDVKTAYLPAPSPVHAPYKDFDDLAREEEWRDVPEAGRAQ